MGRMLVTLRPDRGRRGRACWWRRSSAASRPGGRSCSPLPFYAAGQWSTWSTATFLVGLLLVGAGFFVFCVDVLEKTTETYGGLAAHARRHLLRGRDGLAAAAAGDRRDRRRDRRACSPAPPARRSSSACSAARTTRKRRRSTRSWRRTSSTSSATRSPTSPSTSPIGAIYVLVPRYAGRPYKTTKPFVAAWLGSLVFIATAYSHHLYMDFVQPVWAADHLEIASYGAVIPVAVITIYSGLMLVWGSRYRWTLASTLALPRLRRLGDRRHGRGDRLDDPDQLPLPQHASGSSRTSTPT